MRRRTAWTIAVLTMAVGLIGGGPAFAGRHDRDWHRRDDRWRGHHDYVAPPVVYAPAPAVVAPPLSFSLNIR